MGAADKTSQHLRKPHVEAKGLDTGEICNKGERHSYTETDIFYKGNILAESSNPIDSRMYPGLEPEKEREHGINENASVSGAGNVGERSSKPAPVEGKISIKLAKHKHVKPSPSKPGPAVTQVKTASTKPSKVSGPLPEPLNLKSTRSRSS